MVSCLACSELPGSKKMGESLGFVSVTNVVHAGSFSLCESRLRRPEAPEHSRFLMPSWPLGASCLHV